MCVLHQSYVLFFKISFLQMILRLNHDYRIHEIKCINMTQLLKILYSALFKRLHIVYIDQHGLYEVFSAFRYLSLLARVNILLALYLGILFEDGHWKVKMKCYMGSDVWKIHLLFLYIVSCKCFLNCRYIYARKLENLTNTEQFMKNGKPLDHQFK